MKDEEKQRKFHEALLQMLYPPPPPSQEDNEKDLFESLNDRLPEGELENEEGNSSPSSSDDNEVENGGCEKLSRAQRKRLRKKKLKEAATRRRKIVGPLLPGSSDDGDHNDNVEDVENVTPSVRQNASTNASGHPGSCSKQNKLKQRRKSKKLTGKKFDSSSMESGNSHQSRDRECVNSNEV
ncbi:hypothetical protein BUALT_Bualt11G0066900 [Buddleja alternifolia]|uniref:Uncharacterized protein n=1 Tax=Buddleja alternifolia TaxID=168488 RepID=A0AAV6WUS7_9LAMI|nr:hypothetical protein BUALT_Bualt11G0066900 [Buddleja alternifolia]